MKYDQISPELFVKNRAKFSKEIKPKSVAVFNSNDIYPISADSTMPFQQHRDIFYLSGIDQEESILLICPDAPYPELREILFIKETNDHIKVWEGEKFTKEKAIQFSGIKTIKWLHEFHKTLFEIMTYVDVIYINTNEHYRATIDTQTREARFVKWWKETYPAHQVARSQPILQKIRSVKEKEEIDLIQKACNISEKGFRRILNFVQPNVTEYEIEAEFIHEFIRNKSKGFAYTPIIASGNNSNVLHYIENNQVCKDGELILLDVGAEYANYSSDMTRTIPVNGKFTPRQKQVYQAVLKVKNEATQMLRPGTLWKEYHNEVGKIMTSELLGLGLITPEEVKNENPDWPTYKKYFMHGTSHHLGLDTHDYGLLHLPMQANMIFTVEPGIYIPKEGFGIRLEDDVIIQETEKPFNLMQNIPIEIEEIENLMNP